MIARYTRPEMGRIFSDENRFAQWLEVELAASEALAETGQIPGAAAKALRAHAGFNVDRGAEEVAQLGLDRVGFGQGVEPGVALGRNERQGLVEPATDDGPFLGEKLEIGHAIQADAQTASGICAFCRSRRTDRSEMP